MTALLLAILIRIDLGAEVIECDATLIEFQVGGNGLIECAEIVFTDSFEGD